MSVKVRLHSSLGKIRFASISRMLRHFHKHLQAEWKLLLTALLASLGAVLMQIAQPWPLKIVFDYILLERTRDGFMAGALGIFKDNRIAEAAGVCAVLVLITFLKSQFEYTSQLSTSRAGQKVVSAIRSQLYNHIQKLSQSFHDQSRSGDLLMRLTGDIVMLREMLIVSVLMGFSNILVLIGMITIMLMKDAFMTLCALAVVPALFIISFKMSGKIKDASKRQRKKEGKVASLAHETIVGIKDVQAFAREKYENKRFAKHNRGSLKAGLRATRLEAGMSRAVQMVLSGGMALVLLVGIKRVLDNAVTPGDLLVFIAYMRGMYRPIGKLAHLTRRFAKTLACGERVAEILETEPKVKDKADAVTAPPFKGKIEFKDVTFTFNQKVPALKRVSFVVNPGETVAFVGSSGGGKSTIVNLLLRFYEPDQGNVCIDNRDIKKYTLASLRNQISSVLQESVLFGMSIRDNIGFGRPKAEMPAIIKAAKRANALKFIQDLPLGFDTIVGERGATLSGGEKRRLAIARAILKKSPVLILDEPTVGIDAESETEVIEALTKLAGKRTILIISHNYSTILKADRIFYVEKGRIVESGNHDELMALQGKYYRQCRRQFPDEIVISWQDAAPSGEFEEQES